MLSAAIAAILLSQKQTLTLFRGCELQQRIRYWDVDDTFIDSASADTNFGRETVLTAGAKRTILIRFGDLSRAVGPRHWIGEASLALSPAFGSRAKFRSISRVLVPWGGGPGGRGIGKQADLVFSGATWKQRRSGAGGIGWDSSGARGKNDVSEILDAKAEYVDGKLVVTGLGTVCNEMLRKPWSNYGFAIQFEDDGDFSSSDADRGQPELRLALTEAPIIDGADLSVDSISSSWGGGSLYPNKGDRITYTATITNRGRGSSAATSVQWFLRERSLGGEVPLASLASGESESLQITVTQPEDKGDHRVNELTCRIMNREGDANPKNDSHSIDLWALPIRCREDLAVDAVDFANNTLLAQSRFSFALDGVRERFRYEPKSSAIEVKIPDDADAVECALELIRASGAPDLRMSRFSAASEPFRYQNADFWRGSTEPFLGALGGDTRDDTQFPNMLYLEVDPWPDKLSGLIQMPTTDLLGATHAAFLHLAMGKSGGTRPNSLANWPSTCIVRALYPNGEPIGNLEMELYRVTFKDGTRSIATTPDAKLTSSSQGIAVMPNRENSPLGQIASDGSDGLWLVAATRHGITEYAWMRAYQWVDAKARAGRSASILPLRFNLPVEPIEPSIDLAAGKIVVSSSDMLPETGSKLVDGDSATSVELPTKEGEWIEVDIGRDRTIGQVQLEITGGGTWDRYELKLYGTGQRPADVGIWSEEIAGPTSLANRSDRFGPNPVLTYRGFPVRARYIRLTCRAGHAPMKLASIKVAPLKG